MNDVKKEIKKPKNDDRSSTVFRDNFLAYPTRPNPSKPPKKEPPKK